MKSFVKVVALAAVLATPVVSFAQSNGPVTRAQVQAELAQFQQAQQHASLYDQGDAHYPSGMLDTEAAVVAQNGAAQRTGYGPATSGTSQSGQAGAPAATHNDYLGPDYSHP
ncbi:DUF4148 domain-containing protein [Paraburkholderia rhizosphaerae]|uniref:Uncharacterized protein DUF4148 n=1 Tax=Paraburkholderia rhizosphaerae TaxID=480658 RepID=A0A4R8LMG2_9BURK|nr:DUF4148 domain-containing protein [Paraburkholderia rhizosphaerae]TDY45366.1 uncharacterized protein DUF4148 [Paraburkholderia rhizosphaerae]